MQQKGNKRTITGWVFYDWANSVYPLIISSAIFPILYETQTSLKNEAGRTVYDTVSFLGREFHNTEFYAYVICLSYILVALMTPLLSGNSSDLPEVIEVKSPKLMFTNSFKFTIVLNLELGS